MHPQVADRADAVRRLRQGGLLYGGDDPRGAAQRVAPPRHGGGAGVRFHPFDRAVEPALPLQSLHHADDARVGFQQRPLLDVRLEEGVHRLAAAGPLAGVADAVQFLGYGDAVVVGARQAVVEAELAAEDARCQHGRGEAAALLVRPRHHLHGAPGGVVGVVEGADDLQAGEHAVSAVELAAGGLGIEMAAGHDGRQGWVGTGAAREDVAHLIDLDRAAGLACPAHEQVAALAVHVAQGHAADAAARRGADARQGHQRFPQTRAVNPQVSHVVPFRKRGMTPRQPRPCIAEYAGAMLPRWGFQVHDTASQRGWFVPVFPLPWWERAGRGGNGMTRRQAARKLRQNATDAERQCARACAGKPPLPNPPPRRGEGTGAGRCNLHHMYWGEGETPLWQMAFWYKGSVRGGNLKARHHRPPP